MMRKMLDSGQSLEILEGRLVLLEIMATLLRLGSINQFRANEPQIVDGHLAILEVQVLL